MMSSGTLTFEHGVLSYAVDRGPLWSVAAAELCAIVCYTVEANPAADDYFLIFIDRANRWFTASMYAQGCETSLTALSAALGAPLVPALANSTDWASAGVWPAAIVGQPVLELRFEPAHSWGDRVRRWLGLHDRYVVLRSDVSTLLGLPAPVSAT